jgi:isocitrate lyase
VPIIADIDAGFGNAEATYLLAKQFIEAGACCIQIENQVSDEKQCGHQDGKVTVPHEDFLAKIRAIRYAFLELGVDDGIIVARTDSLGAGLTKQIAVTNEPGDLGDQYNSFLDCDEVSADALGNGDVIIKRDGKLLRPKRLPSNLFQFRPGTGEARCVLDCITSLQTAPTCCGSKPRNRTSPRSAAWSAKSARSSRTPSWCTTTARRSTGP